MKITSKQLQVEIEKTIASAKAKTPNGLIRKPGLLQSIATLNP
ncbi:MAG TPA: hypothetical protein VFW07_23295 [Parafilimonas sp.]|nr:hypothetical protein [Parafilimonas sp.]